MCFWLGREVKRETKESRNLTYQADVQAFFSKASFSEDWHRRWVEKVTRSMHDQVRPGTWLQALSSTPNTPIPLWALHQLLRLEDIWFTLKRGLLPSVVVFVTVFPLHSGERKYIILHLCSHVIRGCSSWETGQSSKVEVEQVSDMKGNFPKHSNFTPSGSYPFSSSKSPYPFFGLNPLMSFLQKHKSNISITERTDFMPGTHSHS